MTSVQFQFESYQRLKKWCLIPPCFILSIIRYGSRVKWSNRGKGVALSPTPQCNSYWKGSLGIALNYGWPTYNDIRTSNTYQNIVKLSIHLCKIRWYKYIWKLEWPSNFKMNNYRYKTESLNYNRLLPVEQWTNTSVASTTER